MRKNFPPISVIVLNWNGLHFLKRTIPLLCSLNYTNYEIIVVDNGSNDGSINFLKKFKKVKVIKNNQNLGYSKGKNIGFKSAKGEYAFSLDNDILVKDKDILQKLLNIYCSLKNIGFLQVPLLNKGEKKTSYYGLFYSFYGSNMHKKKVNIQKILTYPSKLTEIAGSTGGIFFIQRSKWKNIGGFDESQSFQIDDVDIAARSMILGYKNFLYTKTYAIHLGINKTSTADSYAKRMALLFSGHARSMIKNYRTANLLWAFPSLFCYQFLKAIKYSIKKGSLKVFFSFISSVVFFLRNLPNTLRERKIIQSKRKIKKDIFLKIKPPKFS